MKFAVFTDLHNDHIFDGEKRLREFLDAAKWGDVLFIVSLGDLCRPVEQNRNLIDMLKGSGIPAYFAAGNHDLAYNTPKELMEFFGVSSLHQSFIYGNVKFIILNACYMDLGEGPRPYIKKDHQREIDRYPLIPEFEIQWLKGEMSRDDLYYVIFSHHGLANDFDNRGISNREEVWEILSRRKTILCMNGHDHGSDCRIIRGIPCYTLNSMSYLWHRKTDLRPFADELYQQYPYLDHALLYRDPLYCIVEIAGGKGKVTGVKSDYMYLTPEDFGITDRKCNNVSVQPEALDFEFPIPQ